MNNKVRETILKHNLISPFDTVLIALSGGADSVFLAEYLISIRDEYNLTLKAAHVEHGIRGEESLKDCEFVQKFCADNNIECHILHINAPEEAKSSGLGVEEYSRNKRYEFFNTIECDKIATAHSLSDNVETVLFRLARGTALKGMCGIPVKRGKIVRPLLGVSAHEIREYLDEKDIFYCVDLTNSDNDYSRNKIRNNIIPLFKELNPDFENAVQRLIKSSNEDEEYLDFSANLAFNSVYHNKMLNVAKLKGYSVSEIKRVIIKYFSIYNTSLDEYHLSEVIKLVFTASKTQIKDNIFAISDNEYLRAAVFDKAVDFDKIEVHKNVLFKDDFLNKCELSSKEFDFYCDYDKIVGNVAVRCRIVGDKISPQNRNCTKTLKKLYNEYKIPVEKRNDIPVIVDDMGVIGVYGYCIDKRVAVDGNSSNILIVDIHTEDFI